MLAVLISLCSLLSGTPVSAYVPVLIQSDTVTMDSIRYYQVGKIVIVGNEKTKKNIILREMTVESGDVYESHELNLVLEADRRKIMNTRLFNSVKITVLPVYNNKTDILIEVSERWYTFPVPIFSLADRNFNDWLQNQGGDFSRVSYGLKLYQNNTRGRNERLRLDAQFGFTKRFAIAYEMPYIDKSQRHGLNIAAQYAQNKNVAYRTLDHVAQFLDDDNVLLTRRFLRLGYTFRNSFYIRHNVDISYNSNDIADTLLLESPNYFNDSSMKQKYFSITYQFVIDRRDLFAYPLNGHYFQAFIRKEGLGLYKDLDRTEIILRYTNYSPLGKEYYFSNYSAAYLSVPEDQPYSTLSALGYSSDYVRGYELYLIEGQHLLLNRSTIKKKIFSTDFYAGFMPAEQFRRIPISIYLKTYFDMGYARNYEFYEQEGFNTRLSNKFLFGTGIGLDFVTFYDAVFRLEYSFNGEKEGGFFLNFKKEF
ncbi:MAG: POTRA domain-containing protein [Cyclobacteriaceae bacterium]